jgi:hypothetical protein
MSATLSFYVEDITGQVRRRASNVPRNATWDAVIRGAEREMGLADVDVSGRPVQYGARTSRGETVNGSDEIGDSIEENEIVTITKSVTAG